VDVGITAIIIEKITYLIDITGYPGVAVFMMLESMIAPIPSEAVMPFAGCLITTGRFGFMGVWVASTIGSIVGSVLSYIMGYYGGRPLVTRFGKYFLLNQHDLDVTERFFSKYGSPAIFIGRFIPVIRHLISIPAGIGKMNVWRFTIYTTMGASMWNMFLAWLGFHLGNHWELIHKYNKPIDIVMVILIIAGIAYFVKSHLKFSFRKNRGEQPVPMQDDVSPAE
jgi:membrane protein DedA with SNARE-associated domain